MSLIDIVMSRGRQGTLFDQLAYRKIVGGGGGGTLIGTDTEPYLYRHSPSLGAYKTERDEIVGVSVGFNQLVDTTDTSVTVPSGHKYIARINGTWSVGTSSGTALTVDGSNNDMLIDLTLMFGSTIADYIYSLETANAGAGVAWFKKLFPKPYYAYNSGELKSVKGLVSHDMVGKNRLNKTDGATPDKYTDFVNNYFYTKPIKLKPNAQYTMSATSSSGVGVSDYWVLYINPSADDDDYLVITNPSVRYPVAEGVPKVITFTTGATGVIRFGVVGAGSPQAPKESALTSFMSVDWQIEFGSTATDYEPYAKHSYPLDSTVTLRGLLKLEDGKLKADGDVYKADGTVTRKYGVVDLGTLTWTVYNEQRRIYRATLANGVPYTDNSKIPNIMSAKYMTVNGNATWANGMLSMYASSTDAVIVICDTNYATAEAFKTAVSGQFLIYEKNEPTTETAQPFAKNQKVSPSGTEEYVTTSVVPVGHNTEYYG